jgi:imidazolonepropionase
MLVREGEIHAVGTRKSVESLRQSRRAKKIDLGGRVVLPGFVDSHTHLIFSESRASEYEKRIAGATYEQIAKSGGGILSTMRTVRRAKSEDLKARAHVHLREMAAHGTTTIEAKTGYGLDFASEIKSLEIVRELRIEQRIDIAMTFLGAHVVPPEYRGRSEDYVDLVARIWIPYIARTGLAQFCDVFCDRDAFTVQQAGRILTAGIVCSLVPKIHAEQLSRTGASRLAIRLHAASADHLEQINRSDIRALAASEVACTLLPGCNFHLGQTQYAPARELIEAGAAVALATDFNPGTSPTPNMQMILSIACAALRMTPAEAIAAATINGAYALRRHSRVGSIEVGKFADFAAFDVADYREIPYYFGVNHCSFVMKRGTVIFDKTRKD